MKQQKYNRIMKLTIGIIGMILLPWHIMAGNIEKFEKPLMATDEGHQITKTYNYAVSDISSLQVVNKYGDIHINNWAKDSLRIVTTLRVDGKTDEKAEKMKESVSFDVIDVGPYVVIKTVYDSKSFDIMEGIRGIFSGSQSSTITVDYEIWMPEWLNIDLENKFGDIFFSSLTGEVSITQSYGKLLGHKISEETKMNLKYIDARINTLIKATIDLNSSDLTLENGGTLIMESRSSNIDIEEVTDLLLTSNHDKVKINKSEVVDIRSDFTEAEIWGVQSGFYTTAKYGKLDIFLSGEDFKNYSFQTEFSDVTINILDDQTCFHTEIVHKKARMMYPIDKTNFTEEAINKKEKLFQTTGIYGNCKNTSKHFSMKMNEGELKIISR